MTNCGKCRADTALSFDCLGCGESHPACALCFRAFADLGMVEKRYSLPHAKFRVCPTPEAATAHRLMWRRA